jgi:hypothetical protein
MFDEIVKTLILGSSNLEELPKSVFNELRALGYDINSEKDNTEQLLEALAVYAALLKTSSTLPILNEKDCLQKHPEEMLESGPNVLIALFEKVKSKEERLLLAEFFNLLVLKNWRIPEATLPDLLDLGIKQKDIRLSICKVIGERGKWLAEFNPDWNYVKENQLPEEKEFLTASRVQRLLYFTKLRAENPDEARKLLKEIWKNEDPKSKLEFIKCLEKNLSSKDLDVLELAVKDSSKDLSYEAIGHLIKIPDSFIVLSFQNYLLEIVQFESTAGELKIILDGKMLEQKLKKTDLNNRLDKNNDIREAKPLATILSIVPIKYWTEIRKIEFKSLLKAAFNHEFRNAWFWGFAKSLQVFPDNEMMTELHRFLFKKPEKLNAIYLNPSIFVEGPYNKLFNKISLAYIRQEKNLKHPMTYILLCKIMPWSRELSTEFMNILMQESEQSTTFEKYWTDLLYFASYNVDTELAANYKLQWMERNHSVWDSHLKIYFDVIDIRKELIELEKY